MSEEMEFDLSSIAGIDLNEVAEVRSFTLPKGSYNFRVHEDTKLDVTEVTNKKTGAKEKRAFISVKVIVTQVHGVLGVPDGFDDTSLLERSHVETFFLSSADDIGRFKALVVDIGFNPTESALGSVIAELAASGHEFAGNIKHRANKDDADNPYANLTKCKPLGA